ncbi:MAG: glycosyltransferase family 4 protein [Planctomycetaceae bacterium]
MHILFLSHYFPPEVNAPATRTYEHCRRWVRAGHRVTVITCAPSCPTGVVYAGYRNRWRFEEQCDGIDVVRVWTSLAANRGFLRRIVNYVSYMFTATWCALWIRDVDVLVATSPQFFCGFAGVLCRWLRRTPFVLEIRDIWPESIITVGAMRRSRLIRVLEWLEQRMYKAADHIVTVGEGYRRQLLNRGVEPAKISVVPNGTDVSQFKPRRPSSELRQLWDAGGAIGCDKFVCAYIGTIGMAHGLDVVLRAAAELKRLGRDDVVFWMVGDGAERQNLEAEVQRLMLVNVIFTGMVEKSQLADVIASCDACLVHLRGTELFGTVLPSKMFEIMAMNVPMIMGVRGEAADIVAAASAGVPMIPDDEGSLLHAVAMLRAAGDRYRQGRAYVERFYNRDELATQMLTVLTQHSRWDSREPAIESRARRDAA